MDDKNNLVKRARTGDKDALANLVMRRKDQLYRIAWSYLQNEPDTRDALQETIIKAFHDIIHLKNPAYFYTWYVRILINACKQTLQKKKKVILFDDVREYTAAIADDRDEDRMDLQNGMKNLPPEYREVIFMRFAEDLPVKDIADILGIPEGTVKSRIHYGISKLRNFTGERECKKYGV